MRVLTFIRHNLPEPVEKACIDMRMKNEVVLRIYSTIPQKYKNRYHYRVGLSNVRRIFFSIMERRVPIYYLLDMHEVKDMAKWMELDKKIQNYIDYAS